MSCPPKNLSLFPGTGIPPKCDPFFYEGQLSEEGYALIAGVDEAGRGSLVGPVVAAAVIIPHDDSLKGITDSKKMTERAREKAFPIIHKKAVAAAIGVVSRIYIERFNILKASIEAMRRAVSALVPQPDFLLIDGIYGIPLSTPQICIKKGDQLSRSISAASVMAKVYRDRIMRSYHEIYPAYGLDKNKGYATSRHLEALRRHGASPIHRLTFKGVR